MAQSHKRVAVDAAVVDSIPTRGNKIFKIFFFQVLIRKCVNKINGVLGA